MKKLSLAKLRLSGEEVLERSQLAEIYGGSGDCNNNGWWVCRCPNGTVATVYIYDCTSPWEADVMFDCSGVIDCTKR